MLIKNILMVIGVFCAVWVILDITNKQKKVGTGTKITWIILAILFNIITAIAYYYIYKQK